MNFNTMNFTSNGRLLFLAFSVFLTASGHNARAQTLIDFESLPVPSIGFNNGDPTLSPTERVLFDNAVQTNFAPGTNFGISTQVDQTFSVTTSGETLTFQNSFFGTEPSAGFADFFNGFSYSNIADSVTPGVINQYAAFPGSGANGSSNYLVGATDSSFSASGIIQSIDIAPTTYVALAVRDGDDGGAGFVGPPLSTNGGFFRLVISGGSSGIEIPVSFGDFSDPTNTIDVPNFFQTIDVSALNTTSLSFDFEGSDRNAFGLVTPQFFAADNIVIAAAAVPEPSSLAILLTVGGLAVPRRRRRLAV